MERDHQRGLCIDPRRLGDVDVAQLRALALRSTMTVAPTLAEWIHHWCDTEQAWRVKDPERRPTKHMFCLPDLPKWSNKEIGEAIAAAADLHFMAGPPEAVAQIIDRVFLALCGEACERLAGALPRVSDNDGT